jgi:hypothetical protein
MGLSKAQRSPESGVPLMLGVKSWRVYGLRDGGSDRGDWRPGLAAEQPRHMAQPASDESGNDWCNERGVRRLDGRA